MAPRDPRFVKMIQRRAARVAIAASPTRGAGAPWVVACAREFMCVLNLARFGTKDREAFARRLDRSTQALQARLPRRASTWGLSRKLLNIFLRDGLYTVYLSRHFGLAAAERFFEIPLDSITARGIRADMPELPRWPGVKHLDRNLSAAYQVAAEVIARQKGVARVHLDAYWWGGRGE